jgi:FkbM family methyltransferase
VNPKRQLTRSFEKRATEPFQPNLTRYGNYWARDDLLDEGSIVYSFGVGTDLRFDLALIEAVGCKVYCFDPSPRSIDYMQQHRDRPNLHFIPEGIWVEEGQFKYFYDDDNRDQAANASLENIYHQKRFFWGECKNLGAFMHQLGHSRVDLMKIDIEGAALAVLEDLLGTSIRPTQIVVELERPSPWKELGPWFKRVRRLIEGFRAEGYRVVRLPRGSYPYFSIEVLFVRSSH